MDEPDLKDVFVKADMLHAYLADFHPDNSTRLDDILDKTLSETRKTELLRLRGFLSTYHFNDKGRRSRHWDSLANILRQNALDYTLTHKRMPKGQPELLGHLISNITDDLTVHFNQRVQQNELSYDAVFHRVSKRHKGKSEKIPESAKAMHDFTYGDRAGLTNWLKTAASRDFKKALPERIEYYAELHQIHAVRDIVEAVIVSIGRYLTPGHIRYWQSRLHQNKLERKYAAKFAWPVDFAIGLVGVLRNKKLMQKFDPETYKKIRNFLAHEFDNIRELNRSAALMTLIFPNYNDFTKYAVNKAGFNDDKKTLDLAKLIDTSNFCFPDHDYKAWGDLLIEHGPTGLFYLKTAHLLDTLPRNHQGAFLMGQINKQLYYKIVELVHFLSRKDVERYKELSIVEDVNNIRDFKTRCKKATKGLTLPEKTILVPHIEIDGERFDRPGFRFGFLNYNDPYYPIIGRFTDSCERAGGDYDETLFQAYITRKTGVWCIFDEDSKPVAHTLIERQSDDKWSVLIKGFEAQNFITKPLLEKIVAAIRQDHPTENIIVGTSALRLDYEEVRTVNREELQDGYKAKVDPEKIFDIARLVSAAGVAHYQSISDDAGILKTKGIDPPQP